MIIEEGSEQVKFVVVFSVEFLAFLCLQIVVGLVLEAIFVDVLFQLLHPENLQFQYDAIFKIELQSLHCVQGL